ncbi:hypothetical protein A2U01_0078904, partial [Trifolium medium]|nr:hypothetical protein [Trifolium medium]
ADEEEGSESGSKDGFDDLNSVLAALDPVEPDPAQLSYHALFGIQTAQTIQVLGQIDSNPVQVLVDGGSTLNFIQNRVAQSLGLQSSPSPSLK